MNIAEMVKNVRAECHPITNIDGIIKRWLNRGQKVVASKGPSGGWFWLRQYGYTATTVSGASDVALSPLVDTSKLITIYNTAIPQNLGYMSEQEFRSIEPGPTATGDGYLYRLKGFSPVQNNPSSASVLTFVSSSTNDTSSGTNVVVNVQGLNGSYVIVNETVTMNGTTSVPTTNSYVKVLSLSKSTISSGTITCTSNSGGVTNVVIAPSDRHASHPVIAIHNIPDSADTLTYDFTLKLPDITDDNHTSMIPEQYHDSIELYAKWQCFKHLNNPTMAGLVAQEFESRLADMRNDCKQPNGILTMDDNEFEFNTGGPFLPSNFPRGS